jgi:hypothetical protein
MRLRSHSHQFLFSELHLVEGIDISLGTGHDHICVSPLADHGLSFLLQFNRHLSLSLCSNGNGVDGEL